MSTQAAIQFRHRPTGLRSWPQRVVHLVVLVAGWGLFAWGWRRVLDRTWETDALVILIGGSLVLLPLLTVFWIMHNKRIYRVKGPRNGVPKVDETYRQDWNGRRVEADWAQLSMADLIVVGIEDDRKVYRAARVAAAEAAQDGDGAAALGPSALAGRRAA